MFFIIDSFTVPLNIRHDSLRVGMPTVVLSLFFLTDELSEEELPRDLTRCLPKEMSIDAPVRESLELVEGGRARTPSRKDSEASLARGGLERGVNFKSLASNFEEADSAREEI